MSAKSLKRASLSEIREKKNKGELSVKADVSPGPSLGRDFWTKAKVQMPTRPRSVHLKLDPDVFAFFFDTCKGKGHLTHMQNVLKAYADAHRR